MDRREILKAFAFVAGACACGSAHAQSQQGCMLSASAATSFRNSTTLLPGCGVQIIDSTFHLERNILRQMFVVNPDFAFYDDSSGPNAFATTSNIIGSSPHGSVCFGATLLQSELQQPWWGAAIAGIAAHEWAHILQFNSGLQGPTWKRELHADYLAGWYLGRKAMAGTHVVIGGLGSSLFGKGSFDFNNPNWHGTPNQRVSAMLAGYQNAPGNPYTNQAFAHGRVVVGI